MVAELRFGNNMRADLERLVSRIESGLAIIGFIHSGIRFRAGSEGERPKHMAGVGKGAQALFVSANSFKFRGSPAEHDGQEGVLHCLSTPPFPRPRVRPAQAVLLFGRRVDWRALVLRTEGQADFVCRDALMHRRRPGREVVPRRSSVFQFV